MAVQKCTALLPSEWSERFSADEEGSRGCIQWILYSKVRRACHVEGMSIKVNFEKLPIPRNYKETLLHSICLQDWAGRFEEVGTKVLEYVVQIKTYTTLCEIDSEQKMGMIANFYESDPDRPETHSCRQVILTPNDGVQKAVEQWYMEHGNEDSVSATPLGVEQTGPASSSPRGLSNAAYAINSHLWKYGLLQ